MRLRLFLAALTRNRARTSPEADDPRLRSLVVPAPRPAVWRAVVALAEAEPGWTVVAADEAAGELRAEARTPRLGFTDDVVVRVTDAGGATRVDLESASRVGRADLGTNARRIARFLHGVRSRFARDPG